MLRTHLPTQRSQPVQGRCPGARTPCPGTHSSCGGVTALWALVMNGTPHSRALAQPWGFACSLVGLTVLPESSSVLMGPSPGSQADFWAEHDSSQRPTLRVKSALPLGWGHVRILDYHLGDQVRASSVKIPSPNVSLCLPWGSRDAVSVPENLRNEIEISLWLEES